MGDFKDFKETILTKIMTLCMIEHISANAKSHLKLSNCLN